MINYMSISKEGLHGMYSAVWRMLSGALKNINNESSINMMERKNDFDKQHPSELH